MVVWNTFLITVRHDDCDGDDDGGERTMNDFDDVVGLAVEPCRMATRRLMGLAAHDKNSKIVTIPP